MRLTVTGIETIELTDPLDLCQKAAAIQPNPPGWPPSTGIPPSLPRIPSGGPWVTPIPNIGDPVNPIPLPRIDWTHGAGGARPNYRTADPEEKWGRGLTAAVDANHATPRPPRRGKKNGDKDTAYS